MNKKILEIMNDIFVDYFDDEGIVLERSTSAADVDEWDSLAQVGLVILLEKRFKLKFTSLEIEKLSNVGEMADLIHEKSSVKT